MVRRQRLFNIRGEKKKIWWNFLVKKFENLRTVAQSLLYSSFVECNKSVQQGLWNGGQLESGVKAVRENRSVRDNHMMYHSYCQYGVSPHPPLSRSVSMSLCVSPTLGSSSLLPRLWWSPVLSITHSSPAAQGLHISIIHPHMLPFK